MRGEPELAGKWNAPAPAPAEEYSSSRALSTARLGGPRQRREAVYRLLTMRDAKRDGGGACSGETLGVSQENLLTPQEGTEILVWS